MSYSAKHWSIALRVADALAIAFIFFLGYLTWSIYEQYGKIRFPVGISTLLYAASFVVLRGIAKKEKKKAEAAESRSAAKTPAG